MRPYFWRTYQQQEIDYVEEQDGLFRAYEFKWNPSAKARFARPFLDAYTPDQSLVINRDNFDEFVGVG